MAKHKKYKSKSSRKSGKRRHRSNKDRSHQREPTISPKKKANDQSLVLANVDERENSRDRSSRSHRSSRRIRDASPRKKQTVLSDQLNTSEQGVTSLHAKCNICQKILRKVNLKRHMNTVHRGERPYECVQCFQTFTTKANLNYHLNAKHSALPQQKTRTRSRSRTGSHRSRKRDRHSSSYSSLSSFSSSSSSTSTSTSTSRSLGSRSSHRSASHCQSRSSHSHRRSHSNRSQSHSSRCHRQSQPLSNSLLDKTPSLDNLRLNLEAGVHVQPTEPKKSTNRTIISILTSLQAHIRGYLFRKIKLSAIKEEFMRNHLYTKLEAHIRGYLFRKMKLPALKKSLSKRVKGIIQIQAHVRGFLMRRKILQLKASLAADRRLDQVAAEVSYLSSLVAHDHPLSPNQVVAEVSQQSSLVAPGGTVPNVGDFNREMNDQSINDVDPQEVVMNYNGDESQENGPQIDVIIQRERNSQMFADICKQLVEILPVLQELAANINELLVNVQ